MEKTYIPTKKDQAWLDSKQVIFDNFLSGYISESDLVKQLDIKLNIGQTIGTTTDNFSVTNNAGASTKIRVHIDYSMVSDADIKSWLNGNRRISLQRVLRSMTTSEIDTLDNTTFMADSIGKKVKSDEQVKAEYIARFKAVDADAKKKMIAELQAQMKDVDEDVDESEV